MAAVAGVVTRINPTFPAFQSSLQQLPTPNTAGISGAVTDHEVDDVRFFLDSSVKVEQHIDFHRVGSPDHLITTDEWSTFMNAATPSTEHFDALDDVAVATASIAGPGGADSVSSGATKTQSQSEIIASLTAQLEERTAQLVEARTLLAAQETIVVDTIDRFEILERLLVSRSTGDLTETFVRDSEISRLQIELRHVRDSIRCFGDERPRHISPAAAEPKRITSTLMFSSPSPSSPLTMHSFSPSSTSSNAQGFSSATPTPSPTFSPIEPSGSVHRSGGSRHHRRTLSSISTTSTTTSVSAYTKWTPDEDAQLRTLVARHGESGRAWQKISAALVTPTPRTPIQCSTRWLGALNTRIQRGKWSTEEDAALMAAYKAECLRVSVPSAGLFNWQIVADAIPGRKAVQCAARYQEALDPVVVKGKWCTAEDELLKAGMAVHGHCWVKVAEMVPGRTQRQCRTRWLQLRNRMDQALGSFETLK